MTTTVYFRTKSDMNAALRQIKSAFPTSGAGTVATSSTATTNRGGNTTSRPASSRSSAGAGGGGATGRCNAPTAAGKPCTRAPVQGNARCSDHKGMRAMSASAAAPPPSASRRGGGSSSGSRVSAPVATGLCGARCTNGMPCTKPPLPGNKRCGAHKGQRAM